MRAHYQYHDHCMKNDLKVDASDAARVRRIRELNDECRRVMHGAIYLTRGVLAVGDPFVGHALEAVRRFHDFTGDNDSAGEHDFGALRVAGIALNWIIDYCAHDMKHGAEDPSDDTATRRILTIMLAEEY